MPIKPLMKKRPICAELKLYGASVKSVGAKVEIATTLWVVNYESKAIHLLGTYPPRTTPYMIGATNTPGIRIIGRGKQNT